MVCMPKEADRHKTPPVAFDRGLKLGLLGVVDAVLVAGVGQAGAVAAVGAADHLLFIKHGCQQRIDMSTPNKQQDHAAPECHVEVCKWSMCELTGRGERGQGGKLTEQSVQLLQSVQSCR